MIGTVRDFAKYLETFLNVLWGTGWGTLSPSNENGGNSKELTMPRIIYSLNYRETTPKTSHTPKQIRKHKSDNDDEVWLEYCLRYDCMVEFTIVAETYNDCENLAEKFEDALIIYRQIFKNAGVMELLFQKEVPAKYSLNFSSGGHQKVLLFKLGLVKSRLVRESSIKKITASLSNITT